MTDDPFAVCMCGHWIENHDPENEWGCLVEDCPCTAFDEDAEP